MKILRFVLITLLLTTSSYASENLPEKGALNLLKSDGFNTSDFSKPKIDSCDVETDGFTVIALKPVKYRGNTIPKGANLGYCHERFVDIIIDSKVIHFDGFACFQRVGLQKDGKLCNCTINEDYVFKGLKIPKKSDVYLKNGKLIAYSKIEVKSRDQKRTYFLIDENGKTKPYTASKDFLTSHCDE